MAVTPAAKREIWKKWTFLPIIIAREFLMGLATGVYAVSIYKRDKSSFYDDPPVFAVVVLMLLIQLVFVTDLVHMLLYSRNKLKPTLFLITNIGQTCCWVGVVILDLVVIARGKGMRNMFFPILVSLTFLNALIYAIYVFITHRRDSKLGHYGPINDSANVPLNNVQYYQPQAGNTDTSYQSHTPQPAPVGLGLQPTAQPHGAASEYYNGRKG
jgi:hypothetical protein